MREWRRTPWIVIGVSQRRFLTLFASSLDEFLLEFRGLEVSRVVYKMQFIDVMDDNSEALSSWRTVDNANFCKSRFPKPAVGFQRQSQADSCYGVMIPAVDHEKRGNLNY